MKYIQYIFIILLLTGSLSPVAKISAQTQSQYAGTCSIPQMRTQVACDAGGGTWSLTRPPNTSDIPTTGTGGTPVDSTTPTTVNLNSYVLLAPLPCAQGTPGCVLENGNWVLKTFDTTQTNNLGAYLNIMLKIFIGICAVLSVVMIVVGGVEYMTSELTHSKEAGKEKITHAIFGLLIALGAYALLFTINPDLLNTTICTPPQVLQNGTCVNP